MNPILITASQLVSLLEALYTLCIDYKDNGADRRPDSETEQELKHLQKPVITQWGKDLPALRDSFNAALSGRGKAEQLALLGEELRQEFQSLRSNERYTARELEVLKALISYLRTDSEVALKKIEKFAGLINNPYISKRMAPKVGTQRKTSESLRQLVYELVGRDDTALTMDEAKQVKDLKPEEYKQYLTYRREHNQIWKDAAVGYVRNSGHSTVPYEELLEFLHANGIDHMLPLGFTGQVDDLLRMYTHDGHLIDGVPSVITYPSVEMNLKYGKPGGADYVFLAIKSDGQGSAPFYTTDYKKARARSKFSKVADLLPKIQSMQKKWFNLVRKFNPQDIRCVAAVELEILYEFSARVGSMGNAAGGQSTYGVSTLLVKHASVDSAGNVVLRYKGKDGVNTVHKILKADPNQRYVAAAIMQMLQGKTAKDPLFTYVKPTGRPIRVTGTQVNALFRSMGAPEGVTVHKLRTARGTHVFQQLMQEVFDKKPPKDEHSAMDTFRKMAEAVGKILNHVRRGQTGQKVTGTTALNAYIDPSAQLLYWNTLGFRIPAYLEKYSKEIESDN
jgi:Eukaryotic DNA topoisomerase I, catalytic core